MTSITARNRKALVERNGSTIPEVKAPTAKTVAKGNKAVAKGNNTPPVPADSPKPVQCHCGCGSEAKLGRSYLPGHDARHAGQVGRALAAKTPGAEAARDALPPALKEKAQRFADNRAREAARKELAKEIREQAKAELAAKLAEI